MCKDKNVLFLGHNSSEYQNSLRKAGKKKTSCFISKAGCFGGDKRDRTADLLNAIQALSQLSYTPIFGCSPHEQRYYSRYFSKMQALFLKNRTFFLRCGFWSVFVAVSLFLCKFYAFFVHLLSVYVIIVQARKERVSCTESFSENLYPTAQDSVAALPWYISGTS